MYELWIAGAAGLAGSLAATPLVRRLATSLKWMEHPGKRRIHLRPVALGGGVAVFFGCWLAVIVAGGWTSQWLPLLTVSALMLVLGLVDDRHELGPMAKLAALTAAGLIYAVWGTAIEFISNPFGEGMLYVGLWGIPLTVAWLVAVTTMVNNIDGLDGLAAGVTAIACVPLIIIALERGQPGVALLTMALAGSVAGFLPHNFNPARIFLGDGGSLFVGFMLGALAVEGALKGATAIALSIPILVLGLPAFDTTFAVLRRWHDGRPVYQRDQGHVHHRLLALGLNQKQAVLTLYAVSACLAGAALHLFQPQISGGPWWVLLAVGFLLLITAVRGPAARGGEAGEGAAPESGSITGKSSRRIS